MEVVNALETKSPLSEATRDYALIALFVLPAVYEADRKSVV